MMRWLNSHLVAEFGPQYLCAQMGQWNCMKCGKTAPFSWWRSFVEAAREEAK